jgi:hypothetical protein
LQHLFLFHFISIIKYYLPFWMKNVRYQSCPSKFSIIDVYTYLSIQFCLYFLRDFFFIIDSKNWNSHIVRYPCMKWVIFLRVFFCIVSKIETIETIENSVKCDFTHTTIFVFHFTHCFFISYLATWSLHWNFRVPSKIWIFHFNFLNQLYRMSQLRLSSLITQLFSSGFLWNLKCRYFRRWRIKSH